MSPIEKNAEGFILNKIEILQKTTALNGGIFFSLIWSVLLNLLSRWEQTNKKPRKLLSAGLLKKNNLLNFNGIMAEGLGREFA